MMNSKRVAAAAVASLTLAACGSGGDSQVQEDPQAAVAAAFAQAADWSGMELTLSLTGDVVGAITAIEPDDEDIAEALADSSMTFKYLNDGEGTLEMVVNVNGNDTFEVRGFGQESLYFRANYDQIVAFFDQGDGDFNEDELGAAAGMMGFGPLLTAVQDGNWVQVAGADDFLSDLAGVDLDTQQAEGEQFADDIAALFDDAFDDVATATYVDTDSVGDRLTVSISTDALLDLAADVLELQDLGAAQAFRSGLDADTSDAPETINVDVWIADGAPAQIELPLNQFGDDTGDVAVQLTLSEFGGSIDQPDDAFELDLESLFGGMFGGMMGAGGGFEGSDVPDGEMFTDEDLEQFFDEDELAELEAELDALMMDDAS